VRLLRRFLRRLIGSIRHPYNVVAVVVSLGPAEQISIPFKPSKGALRQEIAARLARVEGAKITSIRFQFFQADQEGELVCSHCGKKDKVLSSIRSLPEDQPLPMSMYAIQGWCPSCGKGGDDDAEDAGDRR
jgi:hypothetical protein